MRKQNLLTIIKMSTFILIFFATTLQAQNYEWTSTIGGLGKEQVNAIATDNNDNVYICGSFRETVDFDPSVAEMNITSTGSADVYIEKLNPAGELLWVKTFGSTSPDYAFDLKLDANANVYVIGRFVKTIDFDPGAGNTSITSAGATDIFLEKLDTDGNFQWVKTWGSSSTDGGEALAVDNDGNIYTTGYFRKTIDFDLGTGTADLTAQGSNKNIYIQKMDTNGNHIWVKGLLGANCYPSAITTDDLGNVYTTGYFSGTVDFDPAMPAVNKTSHGQNDIFTQKLSSNGDFVWVSTVEGTGNNTPSDLAVASDGSVFVTGSFNGTADFDPSSNTMNVPTTGQEDGFLQKLDNDGELMFVKRIGGISGDRVNGLFITPNNTIWITGSFNGSMIIDASHDPVVSVGDNDDDVFVAGYGLDGTFESIWSFGSAFVDKGNKILFAGNNLYTVGTFQNSVEFNAINTNSDSKSSIGQDDVFVQKISFCIQADVPGVSASATTICAGETVNLEIISGNLNSASQWTWREGSCTGNYVDAATSTSVSPTETTTYYVSGEGGCISTSTCQTIEITVLASPIDTQSVAICEGSTYTFPDGTTEDNITTNFSHNSIFNAASGCDSTIVTEITVNSPIKTQESINVCQGETYTFADGTTVENIQDDVNHASVFAATTGCDSTVVEFVTPTVIDATISTSGNTLSAPVQEASFQWIDCSTNAEITDAVGPTFTPSESGEYAVVITSPSGCTKTSSCVAMQIVGTLAPAREKAFDVYPNPMTTILNVAIRTSYKEGSLALYHITGKQVYAQNLHGERQLEIDVNDLIQGAYYLKIITDGVPAITKIVK